MQTNLQFRHLKLGSFFIYFFLLYFGGKLALNGLAFFLLVNLIGFFIYGINSLRKFNLILLLPILFYFLHVISALFSEHKEVAFFDLEVKLSFLLLPLFFGFEKDEYRINLKTILTLFSTASILAGLILLIRAFWMKYETGVLPVYSTFSPHLHVTYLASYITLNLSINTYLVLKSPERKIKLLYILSGLISFPIIYFTQSKAGILIFLIALFLLLIRHVLHWNRMAGFSIITAFILIASFFITTNYRFKAMISSVSNYKKYLNGSQENVESTAERIMTWDASIKLIKQNKWFGLGNGDVRIELKKKYNELGYAEPSRLNLNAHNQYLESTLNMGLVGILVLLSIIFSPIFSKEYRKFTPFVIFLLVFGLHFLFESMFNTQAGVVFFMFFYSIFLTADLKKL